MNINPADPATIPKFVDELPKPSTAKPKYYRGQQRKDYYELQMIQAEHCFHKDFPKSIIWGYNGLYPGPTIEAKKKTKQFTSDIKIYYLQSIFYQLILRFMLPMIPKR